MSQSIFYSQRHRRSSSFHSNLGLSSFSALFPSVPTRSLLSCFLHPGQGFSLFSIQGRAPLSLSFSASRLLKKNPFKHQECVHNTPLVPSYWQVAKSLSASLVLFAHNTSGPSGPRRHNSLSNIWTHLSIMPPVSIIPSSQHQKRRHHNFKTGFAYCQWGSGSPLPLW
ncbi:hypothetical protein TNCV_1999721 [Trichonephila clavipes]|nr:hypothetical protein TNCV_1999721 [Trichonephila clavipes]